ncbi:TPA: hypothetical protein ACF2DE_002846 [Clostridium perfringens]
MWMIIGQWLLGLNTFGVMIFLYSKCWANIKWYNQILLNILFNFMVTTTLLGISLFLFGNQL